jgi:hypothetical protein
MPDTNRGRSSRHLRLLERAPRQIPVSASPHLATLKIGGGAHDHTFAKNANIFLDACRQWVWPAWALVGEREGARRA